MFPLAMKYSVKDFLAKLPRLVIWFVIIIEEHGKAYTFAAVLTLNILTRIGCIP